jgi:hypothetical protein
VACGGERGQLGVQGGCADLAALIRIDGHQPRGRPSICLVAYRSSTVSPSGVWATRVYETSWTLPEEPDMAVCLLKGRPRGVEQHSGTRGSLRRDCRVGVWPGVRSGRHREDGAGSRGAERLAGYDPVVSFGGDGAGVTEYLTRCSRGVSHETYGFSRTTGWYRTPERCTLTCHFAATHMHVYRAYSRRVFAE